MMKNMKTYIHVNQHKIRANKKHGTNEPVITIKKGRTNKLTTQYSIQMQSFVKFDNILLKKLNLLENVSVSC